MSNSNISDATDFKKSELPGFAQLDTLLRCHICKDFLKVPVLTPCGHTFCSMCIREYVNNSSKCPLCLNELRESMLRSEFLVSEIVDCYRSLRSSLLRILEKKNLDTNSNTSLIELGSEPESEADADIIDSNSGDEIQIVGTSSNVPRNRQTNMIVKPNNSQRKKSRLTVESMFSKPDGNNNKPTVKMAQCPICQQFFPIKTLERTHLDECLNAQVLGLNKQKTTKIKERSPILKSKNIFPPSRNSSGSKSSSSSPLITTEAISYAERYASSSLKSEERHRLPKLDYPSLSMIQLKNKLSSLGLSTNGTRQNLIDRYNHYEMIWNSNFCDALHPVDENELKRQLVSWEASHLPTTNNTISRLIRKGKNNEGSYQKLLSNFKNDKFERKSWMNLFQKEFKLLIREAREKIKLTKISNIENTSIVEINTQGDDKDENTKSDNTFKSKDNESDIISDIELPIELSQNSTQ